MPEISAGAGPARIVFVGTGGGAHADRAHECIALQLAPDHVMLLDTSGGFEVVRQLKQAGIDLAGIRSVFVSHRHSDHIGGLEPLLLHVGLHALAAGPRKKELTVYAHSEVIRAGQTLLEAMVSLAPQVLEMTGQDLRWEPLTPGERVALRAGLLLRPFKVDHEPAGDTCLGCRVEFEQGGRQWSLVYSGDTRPTPEMDKYAHDADVLIHEVGGVDSNADMVHRTGHSTAGEAARLAANAKVRRLCLIHLPNEYILEPVLAEAQRYYRGHISIPSDLDTLDLYDLEPAGP